MNNSDSRPDHKHALITSSLLLLLLVLFFINFEALSKAASVPVAQLPWFTTDPGLMGLIASVGVIVSVLGLVSSHAQVRAVFARRVFLVVHASLAAFVLISLSIRLPHVTSLALFLAALVFAAHFVVWRYEFTGVDGRS